MTTCSLCPVGTTSEPGAEFCVCQAGDFWNKTDCQTCPFNSVSREGALECVECPEGAVSDVTRTSCTCLEELVWDWEQDGGSCVSPGLGLSSWNSNISHAKLTLAVAVGGLAIFVLLTTILAFLLLRERRKCKKRTGEALRIPFESFGEGETGIEGEVQCSKTQQYNSAPGPMEEVTYCTEEVNARFSLKSKTLHSLVH